MIIVSLISAMEPFRSGISKEDIVYEAKLNSKCKIDGTAINFKKVVLYKSGDVWIEFWQYPTRISAINNNSITWATDVYTADGEEIEGRSISERGGIFFKRNAISFNSKGTDKVVLDYDKYNRKMRVEIPLTGEYDE